MSELKGPSPYKSLTHDDLIDAFPYWSNEEMRKDFPQAKCIGDIALILAHNKTVASIEGVDND